MKNYLIFLVHAIDLLQCTHEKERYNCINVYKKFDVLIKIEGFLLKYYIKRTLQKITYFSINFWPVWNRLN